jgi:chorismate dehydratase
MREKREKERIQAEGRTEGAPRVAASSYLNTVPLVWSFMYGTRRREVELMTDTAPARCADMLARREVEAALVPVIEYQQIPDLAVVPGVCVGARSRVRSVLLVTRDGLGLEEVRSCAVDVSSRTSAALARVIFGEFLGFEPEWRRRAPDLKAMLHQNDAALIIGDPAMTFPRTGGCVYDLADLWRRHTGLGFVFAMWMAREDDLEKVRAVDFAGARDEGLEHVDDIASLYRHAVGLPIDEIKTYLLENISFELDEGMRAGLDLFYKLAHKHGVIPAVRPLKMIGA